MNGLIDSGKSAIIYHCTCTERLLRAHGWKIGNGICKLYCLKPNDAISYPSVYLLVSNEFFCKIYYVVPLMFHGRAHVKIRQNALVLNIFTKKEISLSNGSARFFTTEPERSRPEHGEECTFKEQFPVTGLMKKKNIEIFSPSFVFEI